ncbi:MAG: hypothetical protein COB78_10775 [Hyphomicrobiales bacterium]|nr:MAG: hypothetical protein COB78_10775 [Hyphomicrobiales bacterium]
MSRFEAVNSVILAEMAKPYSYGCSDCFFLALAVIDRLQNTKLKKKYSGIYTTFSGAQKAMRKRKFKSIGDLFAKHLEQIAPAMARLGDVVVLEVDGKEHSAICTGGAFLTRVEGGTSIHSLADVKSAFKV